VTHFGEFYQWEDRILQQSSKCGTPFFQIEIRAYKRRGAEYTHFLQGIEVQKLELMPKFREGQKEIDKEAILR